MKFSKEKIKNWIKIVLEFCLNPRLLLCFGIAWFITNGWSYIALGLSFWLRLKWLGIAATAYLTTLWIPFTPEKIITIIITIFLLRLLFPHDKKTLERLYKMKSAIVQQAKDHRAKRKQRRLLAQQKKAAQTRASRARVKKSKRKSHTTKISRKKNR